MIDKNVRVYKRSRESRARMSAAARKSWARRRAEQAALDKQAGRLQRDPKIQAAMDQAIKTFHRFVRYQESPWWRKVLIKLGVIND